MSEKKKPEVFAKEVFEVWGNSVTLLTPYVKGTEKVHVRYNDCGHDDWKSPNKLLNGQGCSLCRYKKLSKKKTKTTEDYINDLKKYGRNIEVLSDYTGVSEKITVKNLDCGHVYSARAGNILKGSGCPVCHGMKNTNIFAQQLEDKYPREYTVLGEYINNRTPILVRHKCGHEWEVIPKDILRQFRCPACNKSAGEKYINDFLENHNMIFEREYHFRDCRDKNVLAFDFVVFIENQPYAIEYDGTHHFRKEQGWGENRESKVHKHDEIKNNYCASHDIPLLRIPYWWLNTPKIEKELASFLNIKL